MRISDSSGNKPYKVFSVSKTFILVDGFNYSTYVESFAACMLGTYNNAGTSSKTEMYTQVIIVHNGKVINELVRK